MRKIEQLMLDAIRTCYKNVNNCGGNTIVRHGGNEEVYHIYVDLYGHTIFKSKETLGNIELTINMCGYPTNTTRSRLNAILQCHNMSVCQRNGKQFLIDNLRGEWMYTELDCNVPYTLFLLKD